MTKETVCRLGQPALLLSKPLPAKQDWLDKVNALHDAPPEFLPNEQAARRTVRELVTAGVPVVGVHVPLIRTEWQEMLPDVPHFDSLRYYQDIDRTYLIAAATATNVTVEGGCIGNPPPSHSSFQTVPLTSIDADDVLLASVAGDGESNILISLVFADGSMPVFALIRNYTGLPVTPNGGNIVMGDR